MTVGGVVIDEHNCILIHGLYDDVYRTREKKLLYSDVFVCMSFLN